MTDWLTYSFNTGNGSHSLSLYRWKEKKAGNWQDPTENSILVFSFLSLDSIRWCEVNNWKKTEWVRGSDIVFNGESCFLLTHSYLVLTVYCLPLRTCRIGLSVGWNTSTMCTQGRTLLYTKFVVLYFIEVDICSTSTQTILCRFRLYIVPCNKIRSV